MGQGDGRAMAPRETKWEFCKSDGPWRPLSCQQHMLVSNPFSHLAGLVYIVLLASPGLTGSAEPPGFGMLQMILEQFLGHSWFPDGICKLSGNLLEQIETSDRQ